MKVQSFGENSKLIVIELHEDEARLLQHELARALPSSKVKLGMNIIKGIKQWFLDREEFLKARRAKK